jgi:hypothetical protein
MLPSPSLGPPLLSASRSPAFDPWGIPLAWVAVVEEVAAAVEVDELDGLEEFVELAALLPPHAASSRVTRMSAAGAGRRIRWIVIPIRTS